MFLRLLLASLGCLASARLEACPFCTRLSPTLAQRREAADLALLAEVVSSNAESLELRVHQVLKPADRSKTTPFIETIEPPTDDRKAHQPGALLLALGKRQGVIQPAKSLSETPAVGRPSRPSGTQDGLEGRPTEALSGRRVGSKFSWSYVWLNEASFAYVARLPSLKLPTAERLPYFARYFEHADPLLAQDAYLEFGHAPLDEIAKLAEGLAVDRLRDDLADDSTPPERKGLYGLLLGLAADAQRRNDVAADFWRLIDAPDNDFRAGFDGVLAGYLWLEKDAALKRLTSRYLDNSQAATGDVRHFATALGVYHDYGRGIPRERLLGVQRRLLERPDLAAAAVDNLRRWHDWQSLDQVSSLFGRPEYNDALIERAVISYLLACPLPAAERQINRLRKLVPDRVAEAEAPSRDAAGR